MLCLRRAPAPPGAGLFLVPYTHIFRVHKLRPGRLERLESLPGQFQYRVVSGKTATAKTRFLEALREAGGQVLDLEGLANHKGSMFGLTPGEQQPSPRGFDSLVVETLRHFDPAKPVWVESE